MNNVANSVLTQLGFGFWRFPTFQKWLVAWHDHVIPHERNNYHPHLLSHRLLALFSILIIALKVASVSLVALGPVVSTHAEAITIESIVVLANKARAENYLTALRTSNLLSKAAQNKANDMLNRQYFAHNTPDGATPWSFIKTVGYNYSTAGENLAIDFTEAENVQAAWMNSPGHRANILNKNFEEIGIGIAKGVYDNHQTIIVVQMFGTPLAGTVVLNDKPTPVVQVTPVISTVPQTIPLPVAVEAKPQLLPTPEYSTTNQFAKVIDPTAVQVLDTKTNRQGGRLYLEVVASDNSTKVIAFYGSQSIMLDPIARGVWQGSIPLSAIGQFDNLLVQAQDINGQSHSESVAQFSRNFFSSHSGEVEGAQVNLFGTIFSPTFWTEQAFLILLAVVLSLLILAIAIKKHIQHLSLVANTSFVAMLIAMMLIV